MATRLCQITPHSMYQSRQNEFRLASNVFTTNDNTVSPIACQTLFSLRPPNLPTLLRLLVHYYVSNIRDLHLKHSSQ